MEFQRRNIGRLAELPTMGDGSSAYVDFAANPIAMATAAQPMAQEVLPPEQGAPAAGGVPMSEAEAAAAQLLAAAERQRAAAGNPLNRVLSAIGGVVGAPIRFLDAALGGGDMSAVTAPFRPQQTANERFEQTRLGIANTLAQVRQRDEAAAASRASAISDAMKSRSEMATEARQLVANLANNSRSSEQFAAGMQVLMSDPLMDQAIRGSGLNAVSWSPELGRLLSVDKDTASRFDTRNANRLGTLSVSENGTAVLYDRDTGEIVTVLQQGGVGAPTYTPPAPPAPPAPTPRGSPLDPNLATRPVPVRTPDEARQLPSGTRIQLPDGTIGVVP